MKIGLLGGTFDPIHLSHIKIAYDSYKQLGLDQIWFVPVLNNPFNKKIIASNKQRLEMLSLAIEEFPMFKISNIEIDKPSKTTSYTIDTINELTTKYPEHDFYYILGFDQVIAFNKWYLANEIAKKVQLVCFYRKGYIEYHQNVENFKMIYLESEAKSTSSTSIREGQLKDLNHKVLKYFVNQGLYLDTIMKNRLSKERYEHTISVAKLAREIAIANNYNPVKAYITGMFHDIAKEIDQDIIRDFMEKSHSKYMNEEPATWHQWLGAYITKNEFMVDDQIILDAIKHHTTGALNMSVLDKIIFVADKYDPHRKYDSRKQIELCKENIHKGFRLCFIENYEYLKKQNKKISQLNQLVYNKYLEEKYE